MGTLVLVGLSRRKRWKLRGLEGLNDSMVKQYIACYFFDNFNKASVSYVINNKRKEFITNITFLMFFRSCFNC